MKFGITLEETHLQKRKMLVLHLASTAEKIAGVALG
jgi:hypothetical protein